jgi:transcriptional regulator with XRE-family HTH domain
MTRPSADKLAEIAAALGVSIDHLVSGKEGLPTTERMREACLEAVRQEALGWRLSAHFGPFADFMATRMETAIRAIDAQVSR